MNDRIDSIFAQYKKNYTDWNEFEKFLMKSNSKEEWLQDFYRTMGSFQSIFDSNKNIIAEVSELLENLDEETADRVYNEIFSMYIEDYDDSEFLVYVCRKLVPFFEKRNDYSKLVHLYTILQNESFVIDNPEGKEKEYDYSYLRKGMEYIKYYKELDESSRYRIWIMYYSYIVRLADYGVISIDEALDCYDEIMAFSERPDIVKLDEGQEKIRNLKNYIQQALFIIVGMINGTSPETKQHLHEYTKQYFENNNTEIQSLYELPSELYACYLYNNYMEGQMSTDDVFQKVFEYVVFKFRLITSKPVYDQDEIIQTINVIRYLTRLGQYVSKREIVDKALKTFMDFVQNNWVKSNLSMYDRINYMLGKVCLSLISYDVVGIDKEKCLTQLILQRDISNFIHSKITTEIAMLLYREMSEKRADFFADIKSIPASGWKEFLYNASMFHDIGNERILGTVVFKSRPAFQEEKERHKDHVKYGAKLLENGEGTSKYAEVIKGHHVYFDCENAKEYDFDRNSTDLNPFIDIVALAVYIEETTNRFWDFTKCSKKFSTLLNELSDEKNARFNGELVDAILTNESLQKKIEKIVTAGREDIIYDVYRNWEKIQLSQDEESMLNDCLEKYEEYKKERNIDIFSSCVTKLEYLAYNSLNESIRGKAMYKLMMYKFINNQYVEGFSICSQVERLLRKTKNNELLAEYYYNYGNAHLLLNNLEQALSGFLSGVTVAGKTLGCEELKNVCLLSIASVFLMRFNFPKAKEYFELCDTSMLPVDEQLRYLCMQGYCYVQLGIFSPVRDIKTRLGMLMNEHDEFVIYPQFVYMALFSSELGEQAELEKYLKILYGIELDSDDVTYYSDEMFMYIELLDKLERFKEASEILDKYIALCDEKKEYSTVLTKLLNVKIGVTSQIYGLKEFVKYEEKLKDAFYASCIEDAHKIERIEKSLVEEIKLREEHEAILNSKEDLEESVKKAQSDSEQKSQFLSSMSHEIRTPINAILGLNEMIMRESGEEHVLQYATDIQNAGKQLLGIINDVLDYSKIEAGKMEIVPQRYNVSTLINDIKNMMSPKLKEKNLEFKVQCNEEIPDVLLGDDLRIKQILLNLLSNAYKYTQEGFVEFIVDYTKVDEKSINVLFTVKDSGIGLKPEQIEKIASPFERFDLVKNRGVEGTGLGMSIVMKLLEEMKSHLSIESEYEKGSTFSFEIRQDVIEWQKYGQAEVARKRFLHETVNRHTIKKGALHAPNAKVLIVDDNAVNLKVAAALLKRTGIRITTATGGQECLDLCKQNEYHLILLDHMMPDMDGIETLTKLKECGGPNASIPVVALTANVVESADNFYIKAGFDALLTKPIDAEKMEELISSLLPEYLVE